MSSEKIFLLIRGLKVKNSGEASLASFTYKPRFYDVRGLALAAMFVVKLGLLGVTFL